MSSITSKYEYIAKVAECHSITKAAKELYISQPSLTRYIATLESELNVKLFDRTKNPIQLTYAGERYLSECRRMKQLEKSLRKELQDLAANEYGKLFLGAKYTASTLWLPEIIPLFNQIYPGVEINILSRSDSCFLNELLNGTIDLAFNTLPIDSSELEYKSLSSVPIVIYIPAQHPILKGRNLADNYLENPLIVSPEELCYQNFVALKSSSGLTKVVSRLMEINNIIPSKIIYAPNIVSCYRLCAAGLGIFLSTPYVTRYTQPGKVPVIATLADQTICVNNVISFCKGRSLTTSEQRFIDISISQIKDNPNMLPLTSEQWDQLKGGGCDSVYVPF